MRIGIPREIKDLENRVGLVPSSVAELARRGHEVLVETKAGAGIGFSDDHYADAGATICDGPGAIFAEADMIVKVKEPLAGERKRLRAGQILFTYLHLAPDEAQTRDLLDSGAVCIAYETVSDAAGRLPLLAPMSEVAGRMSAQVGAFCLQNVNGGRGVLLGGVPGVPPGDVVILGGGIVGTNAAMMALGLGATVTVVDRSADVLRRLVAEFGTAIRTAFSTRDTVDTLVTRADLVIGAVLIPGAEAPRLVSADMIKRMQPGSAVVDVAIDQGGCFETSHATTHSDPIYVVDDVVHYCVANMPGGVARTSTFALNNVTLPFVLDLADKGYRKALEDDPHLRDGLNVHKGVVTYKAVAEAQGHDFVPAEKALKD